MKQIYLYGVRGLSVCDAIAINNAKREGEPFETINLNTGEIVKYNVKCKFNTNYLIKKNI